MRAPQHTDLLRCCLDGLDGVELIQQGQIATGQAILDRVQAAFRQIPWLEQETDLVDRMQAGWQTPAARRQPSPVLDDDRIKIVDLGLASVKTAPGITADYATLGTPNYMSPEQYRNPSQVDGRSDLFSAAAVVYEALTGQRLFPGEGIAPLYEIGKSEPVDLHALRGELEAIRPVLARALAKDPARRYAGCEEFAAAFVQAAAS